MINEISEQMDIMVVPKADGEFDSRNHFNAEAPPGLQGFIDTGHRIVVRDCNRFQPFFLCHRDYPARRMHTVGMQRMDM
jgi:hypothetical protein